MFKLPETVQSVVTDLSADPDCQEVWLIGSRASGTSRPNSDWDLLVFSEREPSQTGERVAGVDVLHAGPSGAVLLEGQPCHLSLSLENFRWEVLSPDEARYVGVRFLEVQDGISRNAEEPAVLRVAAKGKLLWSRHALQQHRK